MFFLHLGELAIIRGYLICFDPEASIGLDKLLLFERLRTIRAVLSPRRGSKEAKAK